MTDARPDPLVPAEVDLRDLDGFMLNVERLLASELWALSTGEELKAALGLWCRAWKQLPAASLPNNDRILASFASSSPARWPKLKDMAMRGFVLCSDGRFYHRVLAEDALRAWDRKRAFKERSARGNAKRWSRDSVQHEHQGSEATSEGSKKDGVGHVRNDAQGAQKESFKEENRSFKDTGKESLSLPRDRTGQGQDQEEAQTPSPSSTEKKKLNSNSESRTGNGSGNGAASVTIEDPNERIARFQQSLATRIGPEGWGIVEAATTRSHPRHEQSLAMCRRVAAELGKGWPKAWPIT